MSLKSVRAWVAMQQSLRAIEAVGRFWAGELELEPTDVLLILLMERTEQTPTTLGHLSGRKRQQVHRSLLRLEEQRLVEVASFRRRGKIAAWRLTEAGLLRLECLERRMKVWEEHLVGRVDVDVLLDELRATLRSLVNRSMDGYLAGLHQPEEHRRDPNLEFAREAEQLRLAAAQSAQGPSPAALRKEKSRQLAGEAREADLEILDARWRGLF